VQVVAEFVLAISPSVRGQGIGIASAGLLAAQGIGLLIGGVIAQSSTPAIAIASAGAAATVLGSALALAPRRDRKTSPDVVGEAPLE